MDRIFTRIGSGDNLAAGKSTFFIEMEEVALICDLATKNSLVILDEVGRGTSTFDGMAIAQAILEYLLDIVKSKALFATHYHELTELTKTKPSAKNFHLECKEINGNLIFSHKLFEGALGESFGIAVAKLAGISPSILTRAQELLSKLG
jgi:DNA mismatch repair protein MutS